MDIRMSHREASLLEALLKPSRRYLEFGCGGSTVLASKYVEQSILSVDNSAEWIENVRGAIAAPKTETIELKHVDLGTTREWGYPRGWATQDRWGLYSTSVWGDPLSHNIDLFLIDGRFRVACFCEAILHAPTGSIVLIHDFDRPTYQVVNGLARPIAAIDKLSAFMKDATSLLGRAKELADERRCDPE